MDVSQINPQLWCGGAITTEEDVNAIAALGITADIDCREEFDDHSLIAEFDNFPPDSPALKNHPQIAYCYDGTPDDGFPKPVSWFQTAWTFAQPILTNGGVVLSHCASGRNRGPSMAYFLLRAQWKMTGNEAYDLLKQKRPQVGVAYRADADKAIEVLGL